MTGEQDQALHGEIMPAHQEADMVADPLESAIAELESERRAAAIESRKRDISYAKQIEDKIDEVLEALTLAKLQDAKPRDLAIVLGILLDKRENLLEHDPERTRNKKRKTKMKFEYAFDMNSGKGAVRVTTEE